MEGGDPDAPCVMGGDRNCRFCRQFSKSTSSPTSSAGTCSGRWFRFPTKVLFPNCDFRMDFTFLAAAAVIAVAGAGSSPAPDSPYVEIVSSKYSFLTAPHLQPWALLPPDVSNASTTSLAACTLCAGCPQVWCSRFVEWGVECS